MYGKVAANQTFEAKTESSTSSCLYCFLFVLNLRRLPVFLQKTTTLSCDAPPDTRMDTDGELVDSFFASSDPSETVDLEKGRGNGSRDRTLNYAQAILLSTSPKMGAETPPGADTLLAETASDSKRQWAAATSPGLASSPAPTAPNVTSGAAAIPFSLPGAPAAFPPEEQPTYEQQLENLRKKLQEDDKHHRQEARRQLTQRLLLKLTLSQERVQEQ